MLVERLNNCGYNCLYIRPVYLLWGVLPELISNKPPISPRRDIICNKNRTRSTRFLYPLKCILGYSYALFSFVLMKSIYFDKILVCDRYFYQFLFDIFRNHSEAIIRIFPKPDILIFLEGNLDSIYLRMENPLDKTADRDYYEKIIDLYRKFRHHPNFYYISAEESKKTVGDNIFKIICNKVGEKN